MLSRSSFSPQDRNINAIKRKQTRSCLFALEDIHVHYGDYKALSSINLTINKGEIVFITGPSGAGKTTLLKILAGDCEPTQGKISTPGSNVFVAQIFQDLRLIDEASCEENLKLVFDSKLYAGRSDFRNDLKDICRFLGIEDDMKKTPDQLNGGKKQKLAFARAVLSRPDIILADEPTNSLDVDNAKRLYDLLNFLNVKKGVSVIWASHNRDLVKGFPGRIVHLDGGKLVHSGHACFI